MGTPIQVVQERLGHTNFKTTMDIYTHVTEKQRDEIADNFAKYVNFKTSLGHYLGQLLILKKTIPRNVIKTTFLGYYYKLTYATLHLVRD